MSQFIYLLNAFEAASQHDTPAEVGYAAKRKALLEYVEKLESARPEGGTIAAEQRARGLTPEMVAEHYPQTQHQPDECEICHFVFKVAEEALRSPLARSQEKP